MKISNGIKQFKPFPADLFALSFSDIHFRHEGHRHLYIYTFISGREQKSRFKTTAVKTEVKTNIRNRVSV